MHTQNTQRVYEYIMYIIDTRVPIIGSRKYSIIFLRFPVALASRRLCQGRPVPLTRSALQKYPIAFFKNFMELTPGKQ